MRQILSGGLRLLSLMALCLCGWTAQAAVYKWTDASGVVHYDDQNRGGGQVVTRDSMQTHPIKDSADWVGVVPADFAHDVERRCTLSRERLDQLRSAPTLYRRDANGQSHRLSPAQSQQLISDSERETTRLCADDAPRRLYFQRQAESATARAR